MVELLINILSFLSLLAIIVLSFILMLKIDKIKQLQEAVGNLQTSVKNMDEQAKLIVRTDMELNKTQERLDKKLSGLYALQKLSRSMSTSLEETEVLQRLEHSHLEELGFSRALIFLWDEQAKAFPLHLNIGYPEDALKMVTTFIENNKPFCLNLIKSGKALSSISKSGDSSIKEKICLAFQANHFVISPVLPNEGNKGFLFVGAQGLDTAITEGDEELITVLANQLGQALENARLFEKTWKAHQELEKKVGERTRELSQALEEVKLASRRKTDFVSSVTHELRTPLTSIKGYASILLSDKLGQLPEEVKQRLEKVNRHSDELAQFVNDLLDISRIESGRVSMKQEPGDLQKIVEEAADLLSAVLKERQISFSCEIAPDALEVFVDRSQIKRIFINLINNALKFTPDRGKIAILGRRIDNNMVRVDVSDSGCGIPEEAQEKIFEEFYRVDNPINQQVKGTGLGLALVRNIVEAHKGKIWVSSKLGAGATFSFTLPQPVKG